MMLGIGIRRKPGTTFGFPRASSVSLILSLMDSLSFPPVARVKDSKNAVAAAQTDGQNSAVSPTKAAVPQFA